MGLVELATARKMGPAWVGLGVAMISVVNRGDGGHTQVSGNVILKKVLVYDGVCCAIVQPSPSTRIARPSCNDFVVPGYLVGVRRVKFVSRGGLDVDTNCAEHVYGAVAAGRKGQTGEQ